MKDTVERAVLDALTLVNRSRPADRQLDLRLETPLVGPGGALDSLALVGFVMDVEDNLRAAGHELSLADHSAFSTSRTPFRTGHTLVEHIVSRLSAQP